MSSEPTDNPSDKPGSFDSPAPDSWGQPVPDSWSNGSWSAQPDGFGVPPPWPGQQNQQTPPPTGPRPGRGPAAAGDQGRFAQAGDGQSQGGQFQSPPPYREYPAWGQYSPNGQYATNGHHPTDGQYPPGAQYPPGTQYPPGPYGDQWQYFTPPVARNNRAALAALICGIGQFLLGLTLVGNILLAIPAIICGSVALKQIRLRGERGHGMAVAGLVLGIVGVVYWLVIIALIVIGLLVSNHSS